MGSNTRRVKLKLKNPPRELLQYKASSLLKWKKKFDSEWNSLQTTLEELKDCEKRIGSKEKELEAKELELKMEFETKMSQLDEYEKGIENRQKEMVSIEKLLKAKESKRKMEFDLKEKQLEGIKKEIDEKQKQYNLLLVKIRENGIELDRIDKCRKQGEEMLDRIDKYRKEGEEMLDRIDKCRKEGEEKLDRIDKCRKEGEEKLDRIDKCRKEGEEKLALLERSIEQKSEEAETKEKEFQGMLEKYKNDIGLEEEKLLSIVKSFEERKKELELQEKQIEASQVSILEHDKEIKLKEKELNMMQNSVEETLNELEMLQSRYDSLQKDVFSEEKHLSVLKESVDQTAHELKEKQKEFEDWVKDHPKNVLPFEAAQPESGGSFTSLANNSNSGGSLNSTFPSKKVKRIDSIQKINTLLMPQSNPAQVLKVTRDYFHQQWERIDHVGFEASFMKTFISLFEKLYSTKPGIQPLVKEEAMKLAVEWEKRMKTTNENSLEVFGFLQFLSTYDLIFEFDKEAILKYFTAISQHEHDLRSRHPLLECTCEFIRRLIEKKEVIDAAKLICTLKLIDKFPVVPFRRKEIATKKVAAFYAAVKVHNLKSDSSANEILKCDSSLEQRVKDEPVEETQKKRRNSSLTPEDQSCKCPRSTSFSR